VNEKEAMIIGIEQNRERDIWEFKKKVERLENDNN